MGISQNRECEGARSDILMDPWFPDDFPAETEGSESEDGDFPLYFIVPGTEIPKWFNHQSVENSISFWVGRKFPKLAVYIALGLDEEHSSDYGCDVYVSVNGFKKRRYRNNLGVYSHYLLLFSRPQHFLQKHLNDSSPVERNHVEVTCEIEFYELEPQNLKVIKRWGVHVECICPPREFCILNASHDDDDDGCDDIKYLSELPFYGSDYLEAEEYQPPLVLDDTFNVSWLVGKIAKLVNAFCCLENFLEKVKEALRP